MRNYRDFNGGLVEAAVCLFVRAARSSRRLFGPLGA
jgi:hypothetical protein